MTSLMAKTSAIRMRASVGRPRFQGGAHAKGINFSLIRCHTTNLQCDDQKLSSGLARGLPVAGYAPHAYNLTIRPQPAEKETRGLRIGN